MVPASAFYEWKAAPTGKIPYAIARADGEMLAFAGLWEGWRAPEGNVLRTFTIITTDANAQMSTLHSRMPVILEAADWPAWLEGSADDPTTLLTPAAEGILRMWPIDKKVGTSATTDRICWSSMCRLNQRMT